MYPWQTKSVAIARLSRVLYEVTLAFPFNGSKELKLLLARYINFFPDVLFNPGFIQIETKSVFYCKVAKLKLQIHYRSCMLKVIKLKSHLFLHSRLYCETPLKNISKIKKKMTCTGKWAQQKIIDPGEIN